MTRQVSHKTETIPRVLSKLNLRCENFFKLTGSIGTPKDSYLCNLQTTYNDN